MRGEMSAMRAICIAHDSDYGVGGIVCTADLEHGTDVATKVESAGPPPAP
jgi:hypothetical protein